MKAIEEILKYKSRALDGRDLNRLYKYFTEQQLTSIGIELKDEYKGKHEPVPLTRENILADLKSDNAFGFEKALNMRGISAGCMFVVVKMWHWILEDELQNFSDYNYACFGLPLFKATALLYGFENPIGDDSGNEPKYAEGDEE